MKLPQYIFSGEVDAVGLLIPEHKNVKQQILDLWAPGYQLYFSQGRYLLMFNRTININPLNCNALAVVKHQRGYTTGLWPDIEQGQSLQVQFLHEGAEHHFLIDEQNLLCPSSWLSLSDYQLTQVMPFCSAPKPPMQVASKQGKTTRTLFGDKTFGAVQQLKSVESSLNSSHNKALNGQGPGFVTSLLYGLKSLLSKTPSSNRQTGTPSTQKEKASKEKSALSFFDKLREKILTSQLGAITSRQNAKYLQKMMDMLNKGDFEQGLKHAIPLSKEAGAGQKRAGFLGPRSSLGLSGHGSGYGVNLGAKLQQYLEQLYQRSFEKLDKAGRFEEAAFVKAELLQNIHDAIEYLQSKGLTELAAELAEAKSMPMVLIIRLWLKAGNKEKALWFALSSGQYNNVITLLENRDKDLAEQFRTQLVERFCQEGKFVEAIEMGWPVKSLHDKLSKLLEQVSLDDSPSALLIRVKALLLSANPEHKQQHAMALISHFEDTRLLTLPLRQTAISELVKLRVTEANQAVSVVAKAALKSYFNDITLGNCDKNKQIQAALLLLIDDDLFKYDIRRTSVKHINKLKSLATQTSTIQLQLDATPYANEILDMVLLADGNVLLALGEMGVILVNQNGKVIQRFNQPVHNFVPANNRQHVLCLAHRDTFISVFKFELTHQRLKAVKDFEFDRYAPDYDGSLWFVSKGDSLICIDLNSTPIKIFWQVNDLPGAVQYIKRADDFINLVLLDSQGLNHWQYRFPTLTLAAREPIRNALLENADIFTLNHRGDTIMTGSTLLTGNNQEDAISKVQIRPEENHAIEQIPGSLINMIDNQHFVHITCQRAGGYQLLLTKNQTQKSIDIKLIINSKAPLNQAVFGHHLLVNERGSFLLLDLLSGTVLGSFSL